MDAAEKRFYRVWRILQVLVGGALKRIFRFQCELATVGPEPCLIVANHNTDLDPALLALSFPKKPLYFLASEHVFRTGFSSRLLQRVFHPISRMKGATDAMAAMDVIRALRKGRSVCLFGEGNRSFNGVTGPIYPATGKLAKVSGATLVTYKLEGGYLTSPRWSETLRKGRMLGYCVNVYPPEQLKSMTPEQVNRAIADDLSEDAFARQEAEPVAYKGKRLAEGLENALYICPRCGRIGMLKGLFDGFHCLCGLHVRYTEMGTFAGNDVPFENVRDWDAWQTGRMEALAAALSDEPAFSDQNMLLFTVDANHGMLQTARGALSMNAHTLTLGDRAFPLADISDMSMVGASKLVFSSGGANYEICSESPRYCGRKYLTLYQILQRGAGGQNP